MSLRRRLLRLLSYGALLAALILLWQVRVAPRLRPPPPPSLPATTPPAVEPPPAARSWPDLRDWADIAIRRVASVEIQVVDPALAPLPGVAVSLGGRQGTSDAEGRVRLEDVSHGEHSFQVPSEWMIGRASSQATVSGAHQSLLLVLTPACSGPLRVLDEAQRPMPGIVLLDVRSDAVRSPTLFPTLTSDGQGWIFLARRPCGRAIFSLGMPEERDPVDIGAEVAAIDAEVVLVVPSIGEAILQVLDLDGLPLDTRLTAELALSTEALGPGRYRLASRRMTLPVRLQPDGLPERTIQLPIDDGEHVYLAESEVRTVDVTLLCDTEGCPTGLACSLNPCQALTPQDYRCLCPAGDATLSTAERGVSTDVEEVPTDVEQLAVDLRREAAVRGRWLGPLPCTVSLRHRDSSLLVEQPCDPDGGFVLGELRPGPATVSVSHGAQSGAASVVLIAGQEADVGALAPSVLEIDGWIDADFSLEDAVLSSTPWARTALESGGRFTVRGLPEGTAQLRLELASRAYGRFSEWFQVGGESTSLLWRLRLEEEDEDTIPAEDLGDDTGLSMSLRGGDSGAEDSGVEEAEAGEVDSGL